VPEDGAEPRRLGEGVQDTQVKLEWAVKLLIE
jgi:hypothetical protein